MRSMRRFTGALHSRCACTVPGVASKAVSCSDGLTTVEARLGAGEGSGLSEQVARNETTRMEKQVR